MYLESLNIASCARSFLCLSTRIPVWLTITMSLESNSWPRFRRLAGGT